jgi:hypothetical protein
MQTSGLTFKYDSSKPAAQLGSLSRLDPASVFINGKPVNPAGFYWVAFNEQLYNTLVSLGLTPFAKKDTGLFEYALVRDFMQSLGDLEYVADGRVIDTAFE